MKEFGLLISLFVLSWSLSAQNLSENSEGYIDSLLVDYIDFLSSSEDELLDVISIVEGKKQALMLSNNSTKFYFEVQRHYRLGYRYLIEDYGNYGAEGSRYLADGISYQAINKPIYYNSIRLINKLSRRMARTTRMHRFLRLRDKLLWQVHELKSVTVPS